MSTRIYNGMRWPITDPFEVQRLVRPALVAARRLAEADVMAFGFVEHMLAAIADDTEYNAINAWRATVDKITQSEADTVRRSPLYDRSVSVVIMQCPGDSEHLYGIVYAEYGPLVEAALATGEHWPYWNNSDRMDGVSQDEWDHRLRTWNSIMGGDGYTAPGAVGLTVSVDHWAIDASVNLLDAAGRQLIADAVGKLLTAADKTEAHPRLNAGEVLGAFAPQESA